MNLKETLSQVNNTTLTWLLTYDGAAATMVEQTPVQDQEQEAAQDENLAEAEVNLPEQDEYLKED